MLWCMSFVPYDEWHAAAGLIEPVMVDVPDGWYTEKVVLDEPIIAGPVAEKGGIGRPIAWHTEPLAVPLPRTHRELRWRQTT